MAEWTESPPESVDWERHAATMERSRLYKQQRDALREAIEHHRDTGPSTSTPQQFSRDGELYAALAGQLKKGEG